jgi:poly(3-hydroxybutyrate) depolymerase
MRKHLALVAAVLAAAASASGCGSNSEPPAPLKVSDVSLQSKLMGRQMLDLLVTPPGGGKGRPLLVFLHGYGATPRETLSPAFVDAIRRLGKEAPNVFLPEGDTGWWHDTREGPWGSYVLREVIPAALARTGADPDRIAIGGISMGGFGALDLGRQEPKRFCAVGGHSPAIFARGSRDIEFGFDDAADFAKHDLLRIARGHSPYGGPVWIDIGGQDELRPGASKLARELKADGANISFHTWPGAHTGEYWDAHFAQYLRFYADACG